MHACNSHERTFKQTYTVIDMDIDIDLACRGFGRVVPIPSRELGFGIRAFRPKSKEI